MTTAPAVDPERLLKELRGLWRDLGKQDENGVLRACAMTLIVVVDEARDANILGETIADLMHEHPSRAIVIRVRQCLEQVLEARVFAQCWMPFGKRQQICCEQVEIIASPDSLADVASVVRGLIVPDLPSILFCPSENLWGLPQFQTLFPLAGKLILDSCGMQDPGGVFEFWNQVPATVHQRGDLVWGRLTAWRQAVARIFEDRSRSEALKSVRSVQLQYSASEAPPAVLYLAGWFRHVLGEGVPIEMAAGPGPQYSGVAQIRITGDQLTAAVKLNDNNTAETTVNDQVLEVTMFPAGGGEHALRQELSVMGLDPLFDAALANAEKIRNTR